MSSIYQGGGFAPARSGGAAGRKRAREERSAMALQMGREKEKAQKEKDKTLREQQKKLEMIAEGMGMPKGEAYAAGTGELEGYIASKMKQAEQAKLEEDRLRAQHEKLLAMEQKRLLVAEQEATKKRNLQWDQTIKSGAEHDAFAMKLLSGDAQHENAAAQVAFNERGAKLAKLKQAPQWQMRVQGLDLNQENTLAFHKIMAEQDAPQKTYGKLVSRDLPGGGQIHTLEEGGEVTSPNISTSGQSGKAASTQADAPKYQSTSGKQWADIKDSIRRGDAAATEELATKFYWNDQERGVRAEDQDKVEGLVKQAAAENEKIKNLTVSLPKYQNILKGPEGMRLLAKAKLAVKNRKIATEEDVEKARKQNANSTLKVGDEMVATPSKQQLKAAEDLIWAANYWRISEPISKTIPGFNQ